MTIPSEHEYTQFKDCCTILKGPSRVFWHRETKVFEEAAEIHLDAATKNAFQCDSLRVDRDETCGHAYCLFVLPVGTAMDINIFSGASQNVAVERIPLKLQNDHEKNKFGGEELVDNDKDNNVDYSSLFLKRGGFYTLYL
eukprot:780798-Ditylum_brightwellii.AAC.1